MTQPIIYVDCKQTGSTVGSSWWFDIPKELQPVVAYYIDMHTMDDIEPIADAALEVQGCDEGYSESIWMRIGSRRYNLYKRDGVFRFGAGGEGGTTKGCMPEDQEMLIQHFRYLGNDLVLPGMVLDVMDSQ